MQRFLVVLAVLCLSCLPKVPLQRLATRTPVAIVYVMDPEHLGEMTTAPDALKQAVNAALESRNLEAREVALAALNGQRLTDLRMAALKQQPGDAELFVLVEARAHFFSQLDGRYRWEVGAMLSVSRGDGALVKDAVEVPVVLQFDRERETAALKTAAPDIANRLGPLLDGFLVQAKPVSQAPVRNIYFAMVDRFENGDGSNDGAVDVKDPQAFHGGDLSGLTKRLDWLQALGVDTVWLSPVFEMRTTPWHGFGAFHGYWTWSLERMEPRFGDEAALRALSDGLHARGMKLVLDVVINHVGPDAPLLQQHPDWFHHFGGITDFSNQTQLTTFDVHGLPDFANEKPEVLDVLVSATRRWLPGRAA